MIKQVICLKSLFFKKGPFVGFPDNLRQITSSSNFKGTCSRKSLKEINRQQ